MRGRWNRRWAKRGGVVGKEKTKNGRRRMKEAVRKCRLGKEGAVLEKVKVNNNEDRGTRGGNGCDNGRV